MVGIHQLDNRRKCLCPIVSGTVSHELAPRRQVDVFDWKMNCWRGNMPLINSYFLFYIQNLILFISFFSLIYQSAFSLAFHQSIIYLTVRRYCDSRQEQAAEKKKINRHQKKVVLSRSAHLLSPALSLPLLVTSFYSIYSFFHFFN